MKFTVINVGYGDAFLLQCRDGATILLDGGGALDAEFEGYPFRNRADDFLRAAGIERLDAVILSHIHEDHVCGLVPILDRLPPKRLLVPYPAEPFLQSPEVQPGEGASRSVPLYAAALSAYRHILLQAQERGTPVTVLHSGDRLRLNEELSVDVLAPDARAVEEYMAMLRQAWGSEETEEKNALLEALDRGSNRVSLLLKLSCPGAAILAAADCVPAHWDEGIKNLLQNVNVLKLPHHGQIDSFDEHFMREMPLKFVITTASSDRRYNSANPRVYEQLAALFPAERCPRFLFADEREYLPWFSQPDGFCATTLVIDSEGIHPEFVKKQKVKEKKQ